MRTILAAVVLSVFVAPAWAENFDGWDYCAPGDVSVPAIVGDLYADSRADLINAGWSPAEYDDPPLRNLFDAAGFSEVEDCSADGYCRIQLVDTDGNVLRIITHGDEGGIESAGLICKASD